MRRLSLLFTVVLVVPLLGSGSPREYDDATEADNLQGTWRRTETERDGQKLPASPCVTTFRRGTFIDDYDQALVVRGTYQIDPGRKLPQLDCIAANGPSQGKRVKFIYEIRGDTLRIASIKEYGVRYPKDFSSEGAFIQTYKRLK